MTKSRTPLQDPFDLAMPMFYASNPDMKRYRKLTELGAEIGDPIAQYAVATWYLHGHVKLGVIKNAKKAVSLLDMSAGYFNRAAYDLAVCKLRGIGTAKDPSAAFSLFVRAANQGLLAGLEEQAHCLATGIGTKKDLEAARFLRRRLSSWKAELAKSVKAAPNAKGKRAAKSRRPRR